MKTDKALLEVDRGGRRRTLLDWTIERVSAVTETVLLLDGGRAHTSDPRVRAAADGPGAGPAAALLGAWREVPGRPLLVVAADLPDVPVELLSELIRTFEVTEADWVLTRVSGRLHPLCAVYGPALAPELEQAVEAGKRSLWSLYRATRRHRIVLESRALATWGDPETLLRNVNTIDDYRQL